MTWKEFIDNESSEEYYKKIFSIIEEDSKKTNIYPIKSDIFNAFKYTEFSDVKVVILGQDPYHNKGEAHGLSFSVLDNVKVPPSLKNIYKELNSDLGIKIPSSGSLLKWATQGVFLLNSALTVQENKPGSHQKIGWNIFTDKTLSLLNNKDSPVVFVLWGNYARQKKSLITNNIHYIIESAHPSPLSANKGFFGSKPFSKINNFLKNNNIKEIDWSL